MFSFLMQKLNRAAPDSMGKRQSLATTKEQCSVAVVRVATNKDHFAPMKKQEKRHL